MASSKPAADRTGFQITASAGFVDWLRTTQTSIAWSTYQLGKLFFVGCRADDRLSVFERTFNRCMGLWSDTQTIWLASAFQLWQLQNVLAPGTETEDGYDRLYVPMVARTTGDIDVHDVAVDQAQQPVFVNTLFSCLCRLSSTWSFEPLWQPPFVSRLAAEDRCHLNGVATSQGQPRFATACAQTDTSQGWRQHRAAGGCLVDVVERQTIVAGLSMPHSPRFYRGELWLLDSGQGYFGRVDLQGGRFEPLVFCPGYARGLAFVDRFAVVGLSRPREQTFSGLPLDDALAKHKALPRCGLQVVDLDLGQVVQWLELSGVVDELYDVIALPGVRRPKALGLKTDEIRRNVWFEQNGQIIRWTAADQSPPQAGK